MRDIEFINDEYYHIYNRGVDGRSLFEDPYDYHRFCQSMFLFNDRHYRDEVARYEKMVRLSGHEIFENEREPFVKIFSFTLMPNHYHILIQQLVEGGVSKLFQKLNKGYSSYFNRKHERTGPLLEGPFKARHIANDSYLEHLIAYIHLNILDLTPHDWRNGLVDDWKTAFQSMNQYPWSSHQLYCDVPQRFPLVDLELYSKLFGSKEKYEDALREWSRRSCIEEYEEGLIKRTNYNAT